MSKLIFLNVILANAGIQKNDKSGFPFTRE